jgi:hypothetical protein
MDLEMKGLELSEEYFKEFGLPLIQGKFREFAGSMAAGLVGDGSECFGFDDEYSRDHDWGPGFCVWLTSEDFEAIGKQIHDEMLQLPKTFRGVTRIESDWGHGRIGVFEISEFYRKFIGLDHLPSSLEEWLNIPENFLAAATNGKVFYDPLGEFTKWRDHLIGFYPEDIRLKKIASRCMGIAQAGQYNFPRSAKRKEYLAAQYAETKFCADMISLIFLLNKKYVPFYKWMHRAVKGLPILGQQIGEGIQDLMMCGDYPKKALLIEDLCRLVIQYLRKEGLSDSTSDFLLDHGPVIQGKINNPRIRQRNVWID